jgi:hypothetical protein
MATDRLLLLLLPLPLLLPPPLLLLLLLQGLRDAGVGRVLSWEEFLQLGADNPREAVPPSAEDISTIMYTSGTTGAHLHMHMWGVGGHGLVHVSVCLQRALAWSALVTKFAKEALQLHVLGITCERGSDCSPRKCQVYAGCTL